MCPLSSSLGTPEPVFPGEPCKAWLIFMFFCFAHHHLCWKAQYHRLQDMAFPPRWVYIFWWLWLFLTKIMVICFFPAASRLLHAHHCFHHHITMNHMALCFSTISPYQAMLFHYPPWWLFNQNDHYYSRLFHFGGKAKMDLQTVTGSIMMAFPPKWRHHGFSMLSCHQIMRCVRRAGRPPKTKTNDKFYK